MIKILPIEQNTELIQPYFRLVITLGYGEHCNDTFTHSHMRIDDEKAIKYDSLSFKDIERMDFMELQELSGYITQREAEDIVNFINSLWKRKDKNGFEVDHVVLNDGCDKFWWKDCAGMTDKEYKWFSTVYQKYQSKLFDPQIENNWCGISDAYIEYIDGHNQVHKCEVCSNS